MITRIRTRSELLWYIQEHAPSGACRRAVLEGEVVVLGGFRNVRPAGRDGWIVRVRSQHGKNWLILITVHPTKHLYRVHTIEKIPWAEWMGGPGFSFAYDLTRGDIPLQALHARRQAQEKHNET